MIALVAHPGQQHLLQLLTSRLEISAILNPFRALLREAPAPVFSSMRQLLDAHSPQACCFLSPYPGLQKDMLACLERQVPVLSAGPADLPASAAWRWGGQHRFSPLFLAAHAQRRQPAFGAPVYLRRMVGGGTGLLNAWWAACQALAEAQDLVDSPPDEIYVAACKEGQQHHLALSISFANRTTAHLVVAPHYFSPSLDLTLLGSGGLVFSDSAANAPVLVHPGGLHTSPPAFLHPEPAWIQDFLDQLDQSAPPVDSTAQCRLLQALRRALRLRQLVQVG